MKKSKTTKSTSTNGWVRTKNRLPEDSWTSVLFYDASHHWFDIGSYRDGHFFARDYMIPAGYVTHWQPLDRPDLTPKEEQKINRVGRRKRYARSDSHTRPLKLVGA